MILARISKAVRQQNWFAVAIEFLVVVAGVVIGFMVTGMAERRAESERAQLYLERLAADMEETSTRFSHALSFRESVRNFGQEALSYSESGVLPQDRWQVVIAYFNASQAGGADLVDSTYREMVATGELRLIENLELRGEISAYFSQAGLGTIINELPTYRQTVRGLIPISIQNYIWENCYETVDGRDQRLLDCEPAANADSQMLSQLAQDLVSNQSLNAELRYWVSTQFAALDIFQARIEFSDQMLDAIRSEIGDAE